MVAEDGTLVSASPSSCLGPRKDFLCGYIEVKEPRDDESEDHTS